MACDVMQLFMTYEHYIFKGLGCKWFRCRNLCFTSVKLQCSL